MKLKLYKFFLALNQFKPERHHKTIMWIKVRSKGEFLFILIYLVSELLTTANVIGNVL